MTLTLPILMLVGCVRRPTITGSKNDDFHITATFYKDVTSIEIWDYETKYLLWQVGQGRLNTGLCGVDLNYGSIPKGMCQYFPITEHHEPLPVRDLKENQKVYLLISYIDDQFMAPGQGEVAALFEQKKGKLNYIRQLNRSELHRLSRRSSMRRVNRKWKSHEQRNQFIKEIENEISLNQPLFVSGAKSSVNVEVTKTIERLKEYVDRTDIRKAYIDLRTKTDLMLYKQKPPIKDITVLRDLKKLERLDLEANNISNITPLKKFARTQRY